MFKKLIKKILFSRKILGPMRWEILIDFIKKNSYTKMAEIGVCYGETAKNILENCEMEAYFLIDPFVYSPFYKKCVKYKSAVFLKMKSEDVTPFFKDESLDLVFIDGDHSYQAVKQDIEMWLPKVRKGGILAGHDYEKKGVPGVKKAVDEKFKASIIPIEKRVYSRYPNSSKHNNIWWIKK